MNEARLVVTYEEVHANDPVYGGPGVSVEVRQWVGTFKSDIVVEVSWQFRPEANVGRMLKAFDTLAEATRWAIQQFDLLRADYKALVEDA